MNTHGVQLLWLYLLLFSFSFVAVRNSFVCLNCREHYLTDGLHRLWFPIPCRQLPKMKIWRLSLFFRVQKLAPLERLVELSMLSWSSRRAMKNTTIHTYFNYVYILCEFKLLARTHIHIWHCSAACYHLINLGVITFLAFRLIETWTYLGRP